MTEKDCSESQNCVQKPEDDLDSLLDSALDDFTDLSKTQPSENTQDTKACSKEVEAEHMWSEMIKQALQNDPNIRDMFEQGSSEENEFVQDFTKIAEATSKALEGVSTNNVADIMSETLRHLNESSETLQNQFGNPEELANLFQEMGLNGPGAGERANPEGSLDDIPVFMQSLMQSFLSKDILYPSIKEFVDKYPAWLEEHKESLPAEQYDNYCKQLELMRKVVVEYEAESETDGEDVKRQRFQRIMGHMQQMQALGHPPAELAGPGLMPDDLGLGPPPDQCATM